MFPIALRPWVGRKYICKTNNLNEFSLLMITYFYIAAFDMSVGCIKICSELSLSKTNIKKMLYKFLIWISDLFLSKKSVWPHSAYHHDETKLLLLYYDKWHIFHMQIWVLWLISSV